MNGSSNTAMVQVFARTELGCLRERNEDAFLVLNLATGDSSLQPQARVQELRPPGMLVAVCDGIACSSSHGYTCVHFLDGVGAMPSCWRLPGLG